MVLKVLLFGPQARLAQARELTLSLPDGARAADIAPAVSRICPALAPTLDHTRIAINHAFAQDDSPVCPTDEVALIGLVSGG